MIGRKGALAAVLLLMSACGGADSEIRTDASASPDSRAPGADAAPPVAPLAIDSYLDAARAQEILDACSTQAVHRVPVLSLRYFPTVDGVILDESISGSNSSLSAMREKINQIELQAEQVLEIGSTFRPAQDANAHCSLDYRVVASMEYLEALPQGPLIPNGGSDHYPDYESIMLRENICDWVDNQGVREVWLWGYHHAGIAPAESNMAGPHGDISNSYRLDDMPVCANTYTLYNYNFTRGLGEALENHGHQIEAVLRHFDAALFNETFVGDTGEPGGARNGCGNVHFPPNGVVDYDWLSGLSVSTDCLDWTPQRDGELTVLNCEAWGCVTDGGTRWKLWWMNHIPGRDSGLSDGAMPLRNWWDALGDFDGTVAAGSGLHL